MANINGKLYGLFHKLVKQPQGKEPESDANSNKFDTDLFNSSTAENSLEEAPLKHQVTAEKHLPENVSKSKFNFSSFVPQQECKQDHLYVSDPKLVQVLSEFKSTKNTQCIIDYLNGEIPENCSKLTGIPGLDSQIHEFARLIRRAIDQNVKLSEKTLATIVSNLEYMAIDYEPVVTAAVHHALNGAYNDNFGTNELYSKIINSCRPDAPNCPTKLLQKVGELKEFERLGRPTLCSIQLKSGFDPTDTEQSERLDEVYGMQYKKGTYIGKVKSTTKIPHGNGQLVSNGGTFIGEFREGKMYFGTLEKPNGVKYTGEFKNDLPDGEGVQVYPNGDTFRGKFKGGDPVNGAYEVKGRNGKRGTLTHGEFNANGKFIPKVPTIAKKLEF
jgi:hypothetical protein